MPTYGSPNNQGGYYTQTGQLIQSISHPVAQYYLPLTTQNDNQGGNYVVYSGYTMPGSGQSLTVLSTLAVWAISYTQYDGNNNVISVTWSQNYASWGDIWNSRASLTYS